MTKRLSILLLILAALIAVCAYYFYLKSAMYYFYTQSDHCLQFPSLVMELGLKTAMDLEKVRADDASHSYIRRMASWNGINQAVRDCVDI